MSIPDNQPDASILSLKEMQKNLHELRGRLSELERENEILRDARELEWARESERRYRELIENLNDVIFTVNIKGIITFISSPLQRVTGYAPEELVGRPFSEMIHPDDLPGLNRRFQKVLVNQREPTHFRYYAKNGEIRWARTSSYPTMTDNQVTGICGMFSDITDQKRAEEDLQHIEKAISSLLNAITESAFLLTSDGIVLTANDTMARRIGFPHGIELIGKNIFDLIPEETRVYRRERLGEVLKSKKSVAFVDRRSGIDYHNSIYPVMDKDGNVIQVAVFGMDITDRKQSEKIMLARNRLLELAVSCDLQELLSATLNEAEALTGSTVGFYHFVEPDQTTLSLQAWSTHTLQHMCRIEGYGMHYPLSEAGVWTDCIHARGPVIHNDYVSLPHRKGLPAGHAPVIRELVVPVMRGNKIVAILGVGNKTDDYKERDIQMVQSLADFAWEIAEIKRSEKALLESETLFRSLFEYDSAVKLLIDPDTGNIINANEAAENFYGWTKDQLTNLKIQDINTLPSEKVKEEMKTVMAKKRKYYEFRHRRADGSIRDVEVFSSKITINEKNLLHSIIHDVTDRKLAETQLRQVRKSDSLRRMAGAIAHHYNNLLAAVMVNLELAMDEMSGNGDLANGLAAAMRATRRASEMGGMMLAYLGQTVTRHEPLDFSEACRRHLPDLMAEMPKNVTLETALPSPGPIVSGNSDQIRRMIDILITNAKEAIGEKQGRISLNVRTLAPKDIPTSNRFPLEFEPRGSGYACLEVTDSGCGIAKADIEDLFDPFYSTKFTGRGLGLPVTLGALQALDGCISVESELDQGTVFRIYIPLSDKSLPRPKAGEPETIAAQISGTILVAEDEEMVRRAAVSMLTRMGMRVLEARDGVEAEAQFRKYKEDISCVLCDLTMPHMCGWERLAALRRIVPGIPVILTSGYEEAKAMEGNHQEQPQAFLAKPYERATLKKALLKAMGGIQKP